MSEDRAKQNELARQAQDDPIALQQLELSLEPLTSYILKRFSVDKDQADVVSQALKMAIEKYAAKPDYAIGTYYSWCLQCLAGKRLSSLDG